VLARRRPHDQLDALRLGGAREQAGALLEHLAEIERQLLERDLAGIDLRQIEQVVDDLQQHPAEERMVSVSRACVEDSDVRARSSVMPTTPFIGVRSS